MKLTKGNAVRRNELLLQVQNKWKEIGGVEFFESKQEKEYEVHFYKKMAEILCVGKFYYFVFIPSLYKVESVSESIQDVLGNKPHRFNTDYFIQSIHPNDLGNFVEFEKLVVKFKSNLPPEKLMKYKSQYNYRIRTSSGKYLPILQQSITIQCTEEGEIYKNFVVHTDISSLKTNNKMSLSFIGLDGEPSFYDVKTSNSDLTNNMNLTKRELEILPLLAENKSSTEIAEALFVSKETIRTHRKNILAKTNTKSTLELMMLATKEGWI